MLDMHMKKKCPLINPWYLCSFLSNEKSSKVLNWLTATSPVPSPPPSTTSTSATPHISMSFNPTNSLFSTKKNFIPGVLTPKSHESHGNILRPVPLRSRFFPQTSVKSWFEDEKPKPLKPWFEDDKENFQEKNTMDKCMRCNDKVAFTLEPCSHMYSPFILSDETLRKMHDKLY